MKKLLFVLLILVLLISACGNNREKALNDKTNDKWNVQSYQKMSKTKLDTTFDKHQQKDIPQHMPNDSALPKRGSLHAPDSYNSNGDVELFGFDDDIDDDNGMDFFMNYNEDDF